MDGVIAVFTGVIDALAPLGVTDMEMPATPRRIREIIRKTRPSGNNG